MKKIVTCLSRIFACAGLASALVGAQSLQAGIDHRARPDVPGGGEALASLIERAGSKLIEQDGTLSWRALSTIQVVKHENTNNRFGRGVAYFAEPIPGDEVKALAGKTVRVRGYALPRKADEGQVRFLVSGLPSIDADGCTLGGGETFVDVNMPGSAAPVMNRLIVVEGQLELFNLSAWAGYIYRLKNPRIVESGS